MNPVAALKKKFVAWVWNHAPTCVEVTRLASRALEQPLPLGTRLKLRLHFLICCWCKRYFDQVRFLHEHAPLRDEGAASLPGPGLADGARERIKADLRKNARPTV